MVKTQNFKTEKQQPNLPTAIFKSVKKKSSNIEKPNENSLLLNNKTKNQTSSTHTTVYPHQVKQLLLIFLVLYFDC